MGAVSGGRFAQDINACASLLEAMKVVPRRRAVEDDGLPGRIFVWSDQPNYADKLNVAGSIHPSKPWRRRFPVARFLGEFHVQGSKFSKRPADYTS
jgi:hypothetical protein